MDRLTVIPNDIHGADQTVMSRADRHALGRYDTPRPLGQALCNWAIRSPADTVYEPSSGAGNFVQSALYRLRQLGQNDAISFVWAGDVDKRACEQTIGQTKLPAEHVWHGDFMSLLGKDGIRGRRFKVLVGNPPYISVHAMSTAQRHAARTALASVGENLDRRASLWAYFLVGAWYGLEPGGRLAFLLPQTALHAGYARIIMHKMGQRFEHSLLISIREPCFAAAGTNERVVIFLGDRPLAPGKIGHSPALLECARVEDLTPVLAKCHGQSLKTMPRLNGHVVPHLLQGSGIDLQLENIVNSISLGDLGLIRIGAVTGANDFFILSEAQRKHWYLPSSAVVPVLARYGLCTGLRFSRPAWKRIRDAGHPCWLFLPRPKDTRSTVRWYLSSFPSAQIDTNRTFGKRDHWYRTETVRQPDAILRYLGSDGLRMAAVTFACQITNSIHAFYFASHIDQVTRRAVLLSVMSTYSSISAEFEGRSYGSGALKLEPSEAKRVRVLLPPRIRKTRLNAVFRAVEALLAKGQFDAARIMVDDWLYDEIPGLTRAFPRTKAAAVMTSAMRRRGIVGNTLAIRLQNIRSTRTSA